MSRFVTVFAGQLDRTGTLLFADAGHGHALIRRRDGTFERLDATGLPLGVEPAALYPNGARQLEYGDVLLVATDGLRDMLESVGVEPWTVRIAEAVSDWSSADVIVSDLVLWAEAATGGAGAEDDLTVAAAVFLGDACAIERPAPALSHQAEIAPALEALPAAEESVRSFFERAAIEPGLCDQLVLGLHEILANVIVHAGPGSQVGLQIELREHGDARVVEIVTLDDGAPYPGDTEARPPIHRGRGLDICRRIFESVEHRREPELNLWVLTRHVPAATANRAHQA